MDEPIHIAVTLSVRRERIAEFERALADFARRSLAEPGARGILCLYPPPGSASTEYGLMRSFAGAADRDAFYQSAFFHDWLTLIEPMVEGRASQRQLSGLEAWFRNDAGTLPPRWKMALLTWPAVWLVSMLVRAVVGPLLAHDLSQVWESGLITAGVVVVLTWVAMPLVVRMARPWLQPGSKGPR
jgi:uncharacterized protein